MSIAKNARTSPIMRNMTDGFYIKASKWHAYGRIKEDYAPSWYEVVIAPKKNKKVLDKTA